MSTTIKYYRLFEVRLLHEYFLLGADMATIFDKNASDRTQILQKRITNNQYLLNNEIRVVPTEECKQQLENYRLKFGSTGTGFTVLGEGKLTGKPGITIGNQLNLRFVVEIKNPQFKNYTNLRLKSALPASYYFSNTPTAVNEPGNFQSLSQPFPSIDATKTYEMGELALNGTNIAEARYDAAGILSWTDVPDAKGCVNASDRVLLPKAFTYQLENPASALQVEMTLRQTDGTEIKKLKFERSTPFSAVRADFSSVRTPADTVQSIADGWYKLEIKADSVSKEERIYLSDDYQSNALGLIDISFAETDPQYRILNATGAIQIPTYPIFEIRLRSRSTFWRYLPLYQGITLASEAALGTFFEQDGNNLITSAPLKLSFLPSVTDGSGEVGKLPQPLPNTLRPQQPLPDMLRPHARRLYSEVRVAEVKHKIKLT